jgi:hypothetical protein
MVRRKAPERRGDKSMSKDATWFEIDPLTLSVEACAAYSDYKRLYKQAREARQAFELHMAEDAGLPAGKRMIFGYNFGKLSVAIVDDDRKAPKVKAGTQSLAQFLAAQAASGRRA